MSISNEHVSYTASLAADAHASFDRLQAASLSSLEQEELNEVLIATFTLQCRAQGLYAHVVHEATNQQLARRFGETSLATHVAGQTHGNSKSIGADLAFVRWLHRFPTLHQALATGSLTMSHLHELKKLERKQPKLSAHMENAQDFFVEAANHLQYPQWIAAVGYWANSIDPDGELTDPADPKYGAEITVLPNGDVLVTMRMDAVTGEGFRVAAEHEEQKVYKEEANLPDAKKSTNKQRMMTGIMRLITRGFQNPDGSFPEPMIQLVMSEKVAEDLLARVLGCVDPDGDGPMDVDPFAVPIDYDDLDSRCETLRGVPLHPIHALIPLLIGKIRRLVIDDYGNAVEEPNNVKEFRLFTKKQRQVLLALARGKCAIDGCNNPYSWLQMDHIYPHVRGGDTLLENGQCLCRPHNMAKSDR